MKHSHHFDFHKAKVLDDPTRVDYLPPDNIISLLRAPVNSTLMDFGTGTGFFAIEIAQKRPDLTIHAIDIQEQMLDLFRNKPILQKINNIHLNHTKVLNSFTGKVDRLLCINTFHELSEIQVKEMLSVLKPDGMALVIDWNKDIHRPMGPQADRVYDASELKLKLEVLSHHVEFVENIFPYHFAYLISHSLDKLNRK